MSLASSLSSGNQDLPKSVVLIYAMMGAPIPFNGERHCAGIGTHSASGSFQGLGGTSVLISAASTSTRATSLPQSIASARLWDPSLVRDMDGVIARKIPSSGVKLVLSPVVDVARKPRRSGPEVTFGECADATAAS